MLVKAKPLQECQYVYLTLSRVYTPIKERTSCTFQISSYFRDLIENRPKIPGLEGVKSVFKIFKAYDRVSSIEERFVVNVVCKWGKQPVDTGIKIHLRGIRRLRKGQWGLRRLVQHPARC